MNKSWTSCEQVVNKSLTNHEQVDEQVMNNSWRCCEQVVNKSLTSHEQVDAQVDEQVMNKS